VLSRQRSVIYAERRRVLEGEDMAEQVQHFMSDVITAYVGAATTEGSPETWDLDALWTALKAVYPVSITVEEVVEDAGGPTRVTSDGLLTELLSDARHAYAEREEQIGSANMRQLERRVVLSVLDRKWREHLYEMDYLKEGIGLRAMAQRDPLVEYQREGFQLFGAMTEAIKEESVGFLFNLEVKVAEPTAGPTVTAASAAQAAVGAGAAAAKPRPGSATEGDVDPAAQDPDQPDAGQEPTGTLIAKGLDGPDRRTPLQYTAPSVDGDARVRTVTSRDGAPADADGDGDAASGNREDRRKAERQARKRA